MQITEKQQDDPDLRIFELDINASTIDDHINKQIAEIAPKTSMPGFRPGKVPVNVIRKNYGGQLTEEALQHTINEGIKDIVKQHDIVPAMDPDVQVDHYEVGKDLRCTVKMVPLPTIELPDFQNIAIKQPEIEVVEQHVDDAIHHLKLRRSTSKAIEPRAFKNGDILVIDYTGRNEKNEPVDGIGGSNVYVLLGQNSFSEELETRLLKAEVKKTVSHTITYPDDYPRSDLRGQSITYEMTVKELHEQIIPEVDEAFANFYGFPSVETMRDMVKQSLTAEYQQEAKEILKRRLLDKLYSHFQDIRVPKKMSEVEYTNIWQQYMTSRQENTLSDSEAKLDDNQARDMFGKLAKRRVLLALVLTAVSRQHSIGVSEQELQQTIENIVRNRPEEAKNIRETYQQYTARQQLQASLTEQKIIDFILDKTNVESEILNLEDFQKLVRSADDITLDDDTAASPPAESKTTKKTTGKKASATKTAKSPAKKTAAKSAKKPSSTTKKS